MKLEDIGSRVVELFSKGDVIDISAAENDLHVPRRRLYDVLIMREPGHTTFRFFGAACNRATPLTQALKMVTGALLSFFRPK